MNKHIEKAMSIREETPMPNCAECLMRTYADEIGINEDMAKNLATNFGGGMKCGKTCGAITAGLMILGAKGISDPKIINDFIKKIRDNHEGMTDCADLLRANFEKGGEKKTHCDGMICEAIKLIDEYN